MKLLAFAGIVAATVLAGDLVEIDRANDRMDWCSDSVKAEIEGLKSHYGDIHFECRAGRAYKLFFPMGTGPLQTKPEKYLMENWKLFFSKKPTKSLQFKHEEFDDRENPTADQFYQGIQIWGGVVFWRKRVKLLENGKEYGRIWVEVVDTSEWKLPTKLSLTCADAKQRVANFEAANNVPALFREYFCSDTPYIAKRFCNRGPAVIFKVEAETRQDTYTNHAKVSNQQQYAVEATSGTICQRWN